MMRHPLWHRGTHAVLAGTALLGGGLAIAAESARPVAVATRPPVRLSDPRPAGPATTTTTVPPPGAVAAGGFPTAATTGVPDGYALRPSGSLTITTPGTVIDGYDITGTVTIAANNVTIRNTRITGRGFTLIRINNGITGAVIDRVDIDGRGTSGEGNSMGVYGPATVTNSDIRNVENGVTPFTGSVVRGNYIHGLAAPGSPHYDGIQIDGGVRNVLIEHNTIDMTEHSQTAAVMIDNYFGTIDNITVNNNRLLGGGYTVYSDGQFSGGSITNVAFTNNRLGRGHWGYASIVRNQPVWSGNVDDATGRLINRPSGS